jgi:hypothetical protein
LPVHCLNELAGRRDILDFNTCYFDAPRTCRRIDNAQ